MINLTAYISSRQPLASLRDQETQRTDPDIGIVAFVSWRI
jgi:hypothetical protein